MGLFSKWFDKKEEKEQEPVYYIDQDTKMKEATEKAQATFGYFWRELYWEYRRIVPAHDFAMVKIPFKQLVSGQSEPLVEYMWINNIDFDGETITGELINEPNQLTNVSKGDKVTKRVNEIGDWMFAISGKVYGGFTVQAMRSGMSDKERKQHDKVWGLDFGSHQDVLLVYQQKEQPENLADHPMSKHMNDEIRTYYKENPRLLSAADENGYTPLHREAIAGNKTSVEILLELGADKSVTSNTNKTASDYAKLLSWAHLEEVLR